MITKRMLSIFLAVLMIGMTLTAFPITANAVDIDTAATAATEINVGSADDLTAACNTINTNGGTYTINLTGDIVDGQIEVKTSNAVVTVFGNGHKIDRSQFGHPAVNVSNGATLNLGSPNGGEKNALTIVSGVDNDDAGIIYIWPNSTCHMYDNVTLKNHKGNNYLGGGVTVEGGTFIMNGGTIENCGIDGGSVCYGGGVGVFNGGYFEMNGGTIKDCYVISQGNSWQTPWVAGGGVFVLRASFTMNGGTIENCSATNYETSDKFDALGGGVAVITSLEAYYENNKNWGYLDSNFTMNGGTIKDCFSDIGGGALAAGLWYINNKAIATHQDYVDPIDNPGIFLNGGTMSDNDSSMGGAMFFCQVRPSVDIKNMTIDSNSAEEGGAIDVFYNWTHAQIEGCTITNNTSTSKGGAIMLDSNTSSSGTHIKDTTITGNTSGDRGAGIYYDANSLLTISGANTVQNNTYNGKLNNLNIYKEDDTVYPVYVDGDLTGSQIGLSDPTLWDDGKEDTDETAFSEDYLTSGFKTNNNGHPANYFTSDHETWSADFSDVNENEVRLIRGAEVNYYINNEAIADKCYDGEDIFTQYVTQLAHTVRVGDKIEEFYPIPQHDNSYIFKGWYYDQNNEEDSQPVQFGTDKYLPNKNIYAHWIKVEDVEKDEEDQYLVPYASGKYGGFDLAGVQIREEMLDHNFDMVTPGGMRFITTLSMDVVDQINAIQPDNIEYGYVAATDEGWINYHDGYEKLQYVSKTANGINTLDPEEDKDFFGFAHNINCTSKQTNKNGVVRFDHQNYDKYLIYSLVINYEDQGDEKGKDVLARPYIHYTDANGLERVAYSDYTGVSNVLGGCYTNYNTVAAKAGN